jgi:hypothetical protein
LNIFLGISGTGLIFGIGLIFFISLDKVIYSGEVSEGRIVLRVFNEVFAETGKHFENWLLQ